MIAIETKLVACIRELDAELTDGGLYALPEKFPKNNTGKKKSYQRKFTPHSEIFGGEIAQYNLFARLGKDQSDMLYYGGKGVKFLYENDICYINFLSFAFTKVRSYGNSFQLDTHHGKKWENRSEEVRDAVSKTFKAGTRYETVDRLFLMLLLYSDTEKHALETLSLAAAPQFFNRYNLNYVADTWFDPHGRKMWTSAACWATKPHEQSTTL
jgi:hypothetical protein